MGKPIARNGKSQQLCVLTRHQKRAEINFACSFLMLVNSLKCWLFPFLANGLTIIGKHSLNMTEVWRIWTQQLYIPSQRNRSNARRNASEKRREGAPHLWCTIRGSGQQAQLLMYFFPFCATCGLGGKTPMQLTEIWTKMPCSFKFVHELQIGFEGTLFIVNVKRGGRRKGCCLPIVKYTKRNRGIWLW